MIRFFVLTGLIGGALVAWLTTAGVGPEGQQPPAESLLTKFREEGYLPETPNLEEDHEAEEMEVFELPEEDEEYIRRAEAAYQKMMGGMNMGGMKMEGDGAGAAMKMGEGAQGGGQGGTMAMSGQGSGDGAMTDGAMTGGAMKMAEGAAATGGGMPAMSPSNAAMKGEGGLLVAEEGDYDREIVLTMSEWKFSDMRIDVKPGERIKFTVRNTGQIPHEFMFMTPPLMNAVTYRMERADWSLYEHEALFEQALVLPGGEFSFVLTVTEPGAWMFMCMLPYHMQMGMMGQMATEGMAMDM